MMGRSANCGDAQHLFAWLLPMHRHNFAGGLAIGALLCSAPLIAQETAPLPDASAPPASASSAAPAASPQSLSDIGYFTARQLAGKCSVSDATSSSYCFAYIAAVTDTARAYEIWLGAREFCLPAGTSQSETRRAFMTYVSAYPAQASGQAASVVVNALKQTYPCD